jgi:hypothetical protein
VHNPVVFAVLIPVGPAERDCVRLDDGIEALRAVEPVDEIELVLVDDAPEPRDLPGRVGWPGARVVRTSLWDGGRAPDPYSAMVAGTLAGLRVAAGLDPDFVLKLDTDALTIAPFADAIRVAFAADPTLGVVGSYDRMCTGATRDWSVWGPALSHLWRPVTVTAPASGGRRHLMWRGRAARRESQRILRDARRHGYVTGAHCLGGAYAVSPALLARSDLFESEPWRDTGLAEDVVVGIVCHAAGLRLGGLVGRGEPFGLAHVGLPASPAALIERGHSVVHSVKDHDAEIEAEHRAAFRLAWQH